MVNVKLVVVCWMMTTMSEWLAAMLTERVGFEFVSESECEVWLESGNKVLDVWLG